MYMEVPYGIPFGLHWSLYLYIYILYQIRNGLVCRKLHPVVLSKTLCSYPPRKHHQMEVPTYKSVSHLI
jgi:hypothetical protein